MVKAPEDGRAGDGRRGGPSPLTNMSKASDVPQSGKRGTMVSMNTRYGLVQRQYVKPRDPKSPAQMTIRSNLAGIATRWRMLTDKQRSAWTAAGRDVESQRRLGRSTSLTGCQFFIKINAARAAIGLEQVSDPPELPQFEPNPIEELLITNNGGMITLKLSVPSAPAEHTLVLGAAPCSAGRSSARHFTFLGLLPAPARGLSDITELFVARFGMPPAGTRILVRTQQHIDGWDDLPRQVTAIVPQP